MRKKLILISSLLVLGIVSGCGIPQVTFSAFQSTSEAGKLSSVPGETADPAPFNFDKVEFKVTGDMPEGWKVFFPVKNQGQIFKGNERIGSVEIYGYYGDESGSGRPNHSSIVGVEDIQSGLGKGKLYILERDRSTASQSPRTWIEYYAIVPIEGYSLAYNVWIEAEDLDSDLQTMKNILEILGVNN